MNSGSSALAALVLACSAFVAPGSAAAPPKYVILMIGDGAGRNAWLATAMYDGVVGREFYDGANWVRVAATTHSLRPTQEPAFSVERALTQLPGEVYDPVRAWDATPVEGASDGNPYYFEGYRWLRHAPDSANTATTLSTGVKTFVGAINVDGAGDPIDETLAALAHRAGRRVGTVTTVPFNHATPAALGGAHSASRRAGCALAFEMLTAPLLDVIVGAGHPDYDNNGRPLPEGALKSYENVGDERIWDTLTARAPLGVGESVCGGHPPESDGTVHVARPPAESPAPIALDSAGVDALRRWRLVTSKDDIARLAKGPTPDKLLVVPEVGQIALWNGVDGKTWLGGTLQQARGSLAQAEYTAPGQDPPIATVPSLATLTEVALNALDDDPQGFFLHVEGGAVDWAMHENQMGRMIEELRDFRAAVEAAVAWIEAGPGWGDALLVVTADHDHLLGGPAADTIAFDPLVNRGKHALPGYRWLSRHHSRLPVPVFARGAGAAELAGRATGSDPFYGAYLDQADVFHVLKRALTGE